MRAAIGQCWIRPRKRRPMRSIILRRTSLGTRRCCEAQFHRRWSRAGIGSISFRPKRRRRWTCGSSPTTIRRSFLMPCARSSTTRRSKWSTARATCDLATERAARFGSIHAAPDRGGSGITTRSCAADDADWRNGYGVLRAKGLQCYGIGASTDVEDGPKGFGPHSDQERLLETELHRFVRFNWDVVTMPRARSNDLSITLDGVAPPR